MSNSVCKSNSVSNLPDDMRSRPGSPKRLARVIPESHIYSHMCYPEYTGYPHPLYPHPVRFVSQRNRGLAAPVPVYACDKSKDKG